MSEYELLFWFVIAVLAFFAFGLWCIDLIVKHKESSETKWGEL